MVQGPNQGEISDEEIEIALSLIESDETRTTGEGFLATQSDGNIVYSHLEGYDTSQITPGELGHTEQQWAASVEEVQKIAEERGLESAGELE